MRQSFVASLAFWQTMVGGVAIAKPLYLNARQVSSAVPSAPAIPSAQAAPSSAPAKSSAISVDPPAPEIASLSAEIGSSATASSLTAQAVASISASTPIPPTVPVTATLYQAANQAFVSAPASPTTPSSGCVLATQTLTTESWYVTFDLVGYTTGSTTVPATTSTETNVITLSAGLYCDCAGGVIAGVGTSYNQVGTAYLYCETGGLPSTTNAVSTSSPQASAQPGSPLNPDWADVSCDIPSIVNTDGIVSPWLMWNDSGAEAAWNDMLQTWYLDEGKTYFSFPNFILNFFHGPAESDCDMIGQSSCDGTIACGQYTSSSATINSPAGYMIFASMLGLHQILEAFNTGLIDAVAEIGLAKDAFTAEFSPVTAELAAIAKEKQILDIVGIAVGAVLVGLFAAAIPALPFVTAAVTESIAYEAISTSLYIELGATLAIVKDSLENPTVFGAAAEVGEYIAGFTNSLQTANTSTVKAIFDTPDILYGLIQRGAYFAANSATDHANYFDVSATLQELIFANALPIAWSTGTTPLSTFIATGTGVETSTANGCEGYDPATILDLGIFNGTNEPVYSPFDQDETSFYQSVFFCVNNAPYWLMTAHTGGYDGIYVQQPNNLAALNGSSWGGLTGATVVASAVNTWSKNGNQNSNTPADPTNYDTLQSMATGDITNIPGLVQIPVCTFIEAAQVATDDKTNSAQNPFWPCPASGVTG